MRTMRSTARHALRAGVVAALVLGALSVDARTAPSTEGVEPAARVLMAGRDRLQLPVDLVAGQEFDADTPIRAIDGVDVPEGWMGLDIGPSTAGRYADAVKDAGTVFWNGPMGAFEL